jgi:hypothetical protein
MTETAAAAKLDASYRYAMLPAEIDLSSSQKSLYPSGVTIPGLGIQGSLATVTIPVSQVAWGVTIPTKSRNRDNAIAFSSACSDPLAASALTATVRNHSRARECSALTISVSPKCFSRSRTQIRHSRFPRADQCFCSAVDGDVRVV